MKRLPATFKDKLHQHQLKVTPSREQLYRHMEMLPSPFRAEDVVQSLEKTPHHPHRATVYRDIKAFVQAGILREFAVRGNHAHYFELTSEGHHHHFFCTACEQLIAIPMHTKAGQELETAITTFIASWQSNQRVQSHSFKLYGLCEGCQTTKGSS